MPSCATCPGHSPGPVSCCLRCAAQVCATPTSTSWDTRRGRCRFNCRSRLATRLRAPWWSSARARQASCSGSPCLSTAHGVADAAGGAASGRSISVQRGRELPGRASGIGYDGGLAEYMVVPSPRLTVPIGDLDPALAAPLADAALTPYHAIRRALPLLRPGSTAVVVGVGGLGHVAVQLLRVLQPSACRRNRCARRGARGGDAQRVPTRRSTPTA